MEYELLDVDTVEKMREELFKASYYDPLIRQVFDMANYKGLSGEDRYTLLAYHAMKKLNVFIKATLDDMKYRTTPQSILVLKDKEQPK